MGEHLGVCVSGEDMLRHALFYAQLGIPVFPLCYPDDSGACGCGRDHDARAVGKAPLTPHGYTAATTDEDTLRRWWSEFPQANIGLATGGDFGLIVLDVDGIDGNQSITGRHIPLTPVARTPGRGGGTHYYFRVPYCPYRSATQILPGVDVKANGGSVVAPPSRHRVGKPYEWMISPTETPFAEPPTWLVELLTAQMNRERPPAHQIPDAELLPAAAQAAQALHNLAPWRRDDYDAWLQVGMSLSELGDIGLALWEAWSKPSPKYEPGVCAKKWRTFTPGSGVGLGSLIFWAKEDREDRTAPQSLEAIARAVLGHAIAVPASLPQLMQRISPDLFPKQVHRAIWAAIARLYQAGSAASPDAVRALLDEEMAQNVNLDEFVAAACTEDLLPGYIAILEEYRAARRLRELASQLELIADSRTAIVERAQAAWNSFVMSLPTPGQEMTAHELVEAARAYALRARGFPSGFPELDQLAGALEPGGLIFVYGMPGQGKTLLALALARRQARLGLRVGFVSLEMTPAPLGFRVLVAESGCDRTRLDELARNPEKDIGKVWAATKERAATWPLWFAFNVRDVEDLVRLGQRWRDVYGVEVLYIDHLQEITTRRAMESSVQAMDFIVGSLKDLALRTNMAVIVLAQFNRQYLQNIAEGRDIGYESLRGTSRIEQSADRIYFILPTKRQVLPGQYPQETVRLEIKKNRNGRRGAIQLVFDYVRQEIMPDAERKFIPEDLAPF